MGEVVLVQLLSKASASGRFLVKVLMPVSGSLAEGAQTALTMLESSLKLLFVKVQGAFKVRCAQGFC